MNSTIHFFTKLIMVVASAAVLHFFGALGSAQVPDQSPSPTPTASPTASSTPRTKTVTMGHDESGPVEQTVTHVDYIFPELDSNATTLKTKYFKFRLGFAMLPDYTFVSQDDRSLSQVGRQGGLGEIRSGRFLFSGSINFKKPWTYFVAYDINERPRPGNNHAFNAVDYNLTIPLWREARIIIGKQKEPFIYEIVGDATFLPQQERILNPFFSARNRGIRYVDNYLNDRMSVSIGIFNDWKTQHVKFSDGGIQVSGRVTGLPIASKDGREYLHLGLGLRYLGADRGKVRFRGRPESNVIDNYVDTGNILASHANEMALEALYNRGPLSILTEYAHAWVASPSTQNPGFSGFYVTGGYVLTGENRPYDRKVAYARRMIPRSKWGAVEAVARYSYLDLDDNTIKGGILNKLYVGMNWYASIQWKVGVGYGFTSLDRFNTVGHTNALLFRLQWVY